LKKALVIHPRFTVYGGGEILCMYVCKTLQESGYDVTLASDLYEPDRIETMYGLGSTMKNCDWTQIPVFKPRLIRRMMAVRRMFYARKVVDMFKDTDADIVFSTQSSIFSIPNRRMYHFLYDIADLFRYGGPGPLALAGNSWYWHLYYWAARRMRSTLLKPSPTQFFVLGTKVLEDLKMNGYDNSSLIYPPCQMRFQPDRKKKYVLQACRIVPQKRLELFIEIAKHLPQYRFIIAGLDSPLHPGYRDKLFAEAPKNLFYVETPLRSQPGLVEKAKVYLYTGIEPGIGIALVEAIGAGCIPVCPVEGGGGEVVRAAKVGFQYRTLDEAVTLVRNALEDTGYRPELIREQARIFSPEVFQERIKQLL